MAADGGKTWTVISPDLTTNDKSKQQSPAGIGPDGQDVPCTLIAIAESPIERGVIWMRSNDGVVSVTRDGGKHWSNVTANIPNLPTCGLVNSVMPSRHAFGTAYISMLALCRKTCVERCRRTLTISWLQLGGAVSGSWTTSLHYNS